MYLDIPLVLSYVRHGVHHIIKEKMKDLGNQWKAAL